MLRNDRPVPQITKVGKIIWQGTCYTLDALVEKVYTKVTHISGASIKLPEDLQPTAEWEIVDNHSSLYAELRGKRQSENLWRLFEEVLGDKWGDQWDRVAQAKDELDALRGGVPIKKQDASGTKGADGPPPPPLGDGAPKK